MIEEINKGDKENISIVDSTISNSNTIVGSGSGSVNITQTKVFLKRGNKAKIKRGTVKRKKGSFAVNSIAFIKLNDKDICENETISNEYATILLIRLILTGFYANCWKPLPTNSLNEHTPFVEYVVPIFNTSVVNQEKESFAPKTWNARLRWLKVMDLIFYTKVEFVLITMLEEQKEVAAILESEHSGWTQVS
ncbi:hypothetical protein EDC94DRAFT_682022 [Helicostylum pulchrum]|nr:hypothetical protein EDC94DRAFT_682022 [Helicostylum pulchrum]